MSSMVSGKTGLCGKLLGVWHSALAKHLPALAQARRGQTPSLHG
jgi:hypothetical protein